MGEMAAFDDLCAAALRGEAAPWPQKGYWHENLDVFRRRLIYHGIAGLLYMRPKLLEDWPAELITLLREESLARAMWEMRHKLLVADVIEALHEESIQSVVLKGTAYAYGLYNHPAQRIRGDTDLLVGQSNLRAARETLRSLGWLRLGGDPGPFGPMHYQETWQYRDPAGLKHDIDLHWEVTNSRALRNVLDAAHVLLEARPLPRLAPHASCADPVRALIHRAVNRAVHAQCGYFSLDRNEYDPNRLIWAVDIDLLARNLSPEDWKECSTHAIASGIADIALDALQFAHASLKTPLPKETLSWLAIATSDTPATRYLRSSSSLGRVLADFKATPGIWARATYLLARAFPSATDVRAKYPGLAAAPLWTLYIKRIFDGLAQTLRGSGA